MSAYILFIRDEPVHDSAEMAEYERMNRERGSEGFPVKRLAFYGTVEALEGPAPDGVVVLEFPSVEDARAWYHGPGYQAAMQHRLKAAEYRVMIVEGV
ncbi:DUF1330 domain-containing protein [Sphingomonas sp. GC_Shp_3]|jgi:uncharacterized protein (DUF1330 family)|uniref:DUF1330 domain-containing protein n=1 Tax=Sphingomonas sp. GC_Shp_3 TaxID=2937383 RepID=UPI00226A27F4|nr:DUF1330 domain-containing protein [Sphingomonas sp. GC_Shp_3]